MYNVIKKDGKCFVNRSAKSYSDIHGWINLWDELVKCDMSVLCGIPKQYQICISQSVADAIVMWCGGRFGDIELHVLLNKMFSKR